MGVPILFKNIFLYNDWLPIRTNSCVHILRQSRQLHITCRSREILVRQFIYRLHLLHLQCSIFIDRITLVVS